jgi:methionine synthase I (cobalamin-dependent)
MHQPFTYLIKHIPTGKVYYGLRYAKKCNPSDLWTTYFTSSYDVKKLIEQDGKDAFLFEVRKTFTDIKHAIEWEKRVLRRMKVIKRADFINRNIPGSSMFAHSEETKEKMRKPKPVGFGEKLKGNKHATVTKGIPKTKEHAENISKGKKGKAPFKGKEHPRYGKKKSEQEILKMSASLKKKKWMNNGLNCAFVDPDDIESYLARGYNMGRGSLKLKKEI